ncbi:hypothetical protein Acr_03g0001490 [Actinidia rufa]|uniref:VAN3-binding protein-like auxin canalisation domain-containing protein n=1 Tax=Actinidia rufa TaxID=165716 RepID=A0A7J0EAF6_9ERIC|nr:hypothetical protein Acr_03g0001490 [Actinidia rufa]
MMNGIIAIIVCRRAVHVSVYDKNVEDQVRPTVVPEDVIGSQPDKYWTPDPQTGVFGPATLHNPGEGGASSSNGRKDSLAAAIAGFTTNCNSEAQDIICITNGGGTLAWNQDMGVVVASAAALLTTVCAEAAESLGAKHAHVASAVKLGLATQTLIDMITIAATAATCLRGAAKLKSRAKAETYFPRNQELLKVGIQTLILMPSDKIINVIQEIKEAKGYFVTLKTNKGIIKLFFEDEKQSII